MRTDEDEIQLRLAAYNLSIQDPRHPTPQEVYDFLTEGDRPPEPVLRLVPEPGPEYVYSPTTEQVREHLRHGGEVQYAYFGWDHDEWRASVNKIKEWEDVEDPYKVWDDYRLVPLTEGTDVPS